MSKTILKKIKSKELMIAAENQSVEFTNKASNVSNKVIIKNPFLSAYF
jgi:hypothetical protein